MVLGRVNIHTFLQHVDGLVTGNVITDAKDRQYNRKYVWREEGEFLNIQREDGHGDEVKMLKELELDESLISFFGLYSGDGAKGSEDPTNSNRILPTISFSQKQNHLIRFAVDQFQKIFPGNIRFTFSLGEDSAYFMAGTGRDRLIDYYRSDDNEDMLNVLPLETIRPDLNAADLSYLGEVRPDVTTSNADNLAFYYHHKEAMQTILTADKEIELRTVGLNPSSEKVKVTASLRRPFKKGARLPGGSSRSDEIHLGGVNGLGELFLKILHEIEDSILRDSINSSTGLISWTNSPNTIGQNLDLLDFFKNNSFGIINNARPEKLTEDGDYISGQWKHSATTLFKKNILLDPLWCYVSGLYLAEGSTPKDSLFKMFGTSPRSLSLGFTSSEGVSLQLMLRALQKLFRVEDCLSAWKVKVGSQYFPELVVTGLKNGISMLRGGNSGDGKLRTMEISLSIKQWALKVADLPLNGTKSLLSENYSDNYSHVEPTGAGVARIDFWASSKICRWYFPVLMYTVFGGIIGEPSKDFYGE